MADNRSEYFFDTLKDIIEDGTDLVISDVFDFDVSPFVYILIGTDKKGQLYAEGSRITKEENEVVFELYIGLSNKKDTKEEGKLRKKIHAYVDRIEYLFRTYPRAEIFTYYIDSTAKYNLNITDLHISTNEKTIDRANRQYWLGFEGHIFYDINYL